MNPYQFEVSCSVCGESGMGTIRAAGASWMGGAVHRDPQVCRDNLRRQREKIERDKAAMLKSQDSASAACSWSDENGR